MKVDIYCRVSTEDQNVKQQAEYLKKWCGREGHKINSIIVDKESGRLPLTDRKKFRKLLAKSTSQAIVIYNLDRLTRNWDDVTLIEKHFRDSWQKTKLISSSDPIDLSNASGRLMFRIRMATSCYMPEDMREKQKIGIERAKKEGKYKGGKKGRSWAKK
jgi:DNA invertase Pin-like site-specific DNA recombinase